MNDAQMTAMFSELEKIANDIKKKMRNQSDGSTALYNTETGKMTGFAFNKRPNSFLKRQKQSWSPESLRDDVKGNTWNLKAGIAPKEKK